MGNGTRKEKDSLALDILRGTGTERIEQDSNHSHPKTGDRSKGNSNCREGNPIQENWQCSGLA